jgi:hypothetical protein
MRDCEAPSRGVSLAPAGRGARDRAEFVPRRGRIEAELAEDAAIVVRDRRRAVERQRPERPRVARGEDPRLRQRGHEIRGG